MISTCRGTRLEVRTSIIKENAQKLKAIAGDGFFCPMVKANAYGHGVQKVAGALDELGVAYFGVATWDEAFELRDLGFKQDILVFSRVHDDEEADIAIRFKLTPVVSRIEDLTRLDKQARKANSSLNVHIKFDTGIHRMGFALEQSSEVLDLLSKLNGIRMTGLLTHMSHGEDGSEVGGMTDRQVQRFLKLNDQFKSYSPQVHVFNTLGMLERSKSFADVPLLGCRPGIGLYGAVGDSRLSSKPALRVVSQIDHLQKVKSREGVSYGWRWKADEDSLIGVVPIGYGDGYFRSLGNKAFVLVHGQRVPVVGSVCMDYILIDLTKLARSQSVNVADEVVVLGEQGSGVISPMELANWGGTISYEVLTGLGLKRNRLEVC